MLSHSDLTPPNLEKSKGLSFLSVTAFLVIGISSLWLTSKIAPAYYERAIMSKAVEHIAKTGNLKNKTEQEAYHALTTHLSTQNLTLSREDFVFDNTKNPPVLKAYYSKEIKINKFLSLNAEEWIVKKASGGAVDE